MKSLRGFKSKMARKYPLHHTFRCTEETQARLNYMLEMTGYTKSFLIRECIDFFFDSEYGKG